ncbi:hypothetical protein C9374_014020 [Naegleria lovaniensis]|uniref:RGS domain-containing protein n=1 Tax=Naegleria lovaniensis TaxID=51637 RepID=A0AA88GYM9_NAELO|nr:uncharacterized protein C9374_014020 [Naegleria lovaniensis]KAG2389460.1 hypothetical protein C9374_014020 [Naegleria lovaniensis]
MSAVHLTPRKTIPPAMLVVWSSVATMLLSSLFYSYHQSMIFSSSFFFHNTTNHTNHSNKETLGLPVVMSSFFQFSNSSLFVHAQQQEYSCLQLSQSDTASVMIPSQDYLRYRFEFKSESPVYRSRFFADLFLSGISNEWNQLDGQMFAFFAVIKMDDTFRKELLKTKILSNNQQQQQQVLEFNSSWLPYLYNSTFYVKRNLKNSIVYYPLNFDARINLDPNMIPSLNLSYSLHYLNSDQLYRNMIRLDALNFTSQHHEDASSFGNLIMGDGLENTLSMFLPSNPKQYNLTVLSPLYTSTMIGSNRSEPQQQQQLDVNLSSTCSLLYNPSKNPNMNHEFLLLSFMVRDSTYTQLFDTMQMESQGLFAPLPYKISQFRYSFSYFNDSVECSDFPFTSLYTSYIRVVNVIDWFSVGLIVLLLIPMYFIYRHEQPLKSRLIVPYLGIIFLIILFISIRYDTQPNPSTARKNIVAVAFFLMMLLSFIVQTARYYYLRWVYQRITTTKKQHFITRILTSKYFYFIAVLISMCLGFIYLIIIFSVSETLTIDSGAIDITRIVFPSATALILLICIVVDVILNFKTFFSKNIGKFFFFDDPLFFRSELLFIVPIAIFFALDNALSAAVTKFVTVKTFSIGSTDSLYSLSIDSLKTMIGFFGVFHFADNMMFILLLGEAMVLIVTIFRLIMRNYKSGKKGIFLLAPTKNPFGTFKSVQDNFEEAQEIDTFLLKDDGYKLMEDFSKHEFSTENLLAWDIVQKLKDEKDNQIKYDLLMEIHEKFIRTGSEFEINIPSSTKKAFEKFVAEVKEKKCEIDFNRIEPLKIEISMNLNDTFSRLSLSEEYNAMVSKWKAEEVTALKV